MFATTNDAYRGDDMPILRPLPPAAPDHPDPLLRAYYAPLLAAWSPAQRRLARAVDLWLVGWRPDPEQRQYGIPAAEWSVMRGVVPAPGFASMQMRRGLHALLNPAALPIRAGLLKDKARFVRAAAAANLPVPDTLAPDEPAAPWLSRRAAVVLKPNFSSHGRGIARWSRDADGWRATDGRRLAAPAFHAHAARLVARGGVVQAALATDPALADVSPDALPTLRLMTLRDEGGSPAVVFRALRLGGGGAPVDNFALGGLALLLEPDGRPGPAWGRGPDARPIPLDRHPRTGARLDAGLPPATLAAADALAVRAHAAVGEGYAVIAWDVGVTTAGPVLVEGNWNPGTNILQLLSGRPLSDGRLGELYRLAVSRVPAVAWARARPVERDGG